MTRLYISNILNTGPNTISKINKDEILETNDKVNISVYALTKKINNTLLQIRTKLNLITNEVCLSVSLLDISAANTVCFIIIFGKKEKKKKEKKMNVSILKMEKGKEEKKKKMGTMNKSINESITSTSRQTSKTYWKRSINDCNCTRKYPSHNSI